MLRYKSVKTFAIHYSILYFYTKNIDNHGFIKALCVFYPTFKLFVKHSNNQTFIQ